MAVSHEMSCIGEFCFTLFDDSSLYQSFEEAKSWCQKNASSSKLITIMDNETRDAVWQFLGQLNASSSDLIYIDAKRQKSSIKTWYLVNGSNYNGDIGDQNFEGYWLYGRINRDNQGSYVRCSRPDQRLYFICQFNTTVCSNSSDVFFYERQCYVKYDTENVTWYEARNTCISKGGDLATFNYPKATNGQKYGPPFDASWLILNLSYWVGIRFYNWSWISPSDDGNETLYDGWSTGKPSNVNYNCICLDPKGNPEWSWTDCNCSVRRPFLCVKKVPTTTYTTTKPTTSKEKTESVVIPTSSSDATTNLSFEKKLIIGLVVGVGGSLLIIFIVVVIIVIIRCRKRNGDVNSDRSSDQLEPENSKSKRPGAFDNSNNYLSESSAKDGDGEYAAVVVNTALHQQKTESSESCPEILYTSFDHGPKSSSASNDPDEVDDGRVVYKPGRSQTIYAPSDDDVYANARE